MILLRKPVVFRAGSITFKAKLLISTYKSQVCPKRLSETYPMSKPCGAIFWMGRREAYDNERVIGQVWMG